MGGGRWPCLQGEGWGGVRGSRWLCRPYAADLVPPSAGQMARYRGVPSVSQPATKASASSRGHNNKCLAHYAHTKHPGRLVSLGLG